MKPFDPATNDDDVTYVELSLEFGLELATEEFNKYVYAAPKKSAMNPYPELVLIGEALAIAERFAPRTATGMLVALGKLSELMTEEITYIPLASTLKGLMRQSLVWWITQELLRPFDIPVTLSMVTNQEKSA